MKIDERCLPYAEEMKTCGYCAEGEYLAAFGIKICELDASKLYLFKEQSHRGRVIVASKLHVSEITALTDDERNAPENHTTVRWTLVQDGDVVRFDMSK